MTSPLDPPRQSPLLAALGLDLESSLAEEPRFLIDPRFLGALHAELREEMSPQEAAAALMQMAFVHGLRDAAHVLNQGLGPDPRAIPAILPTTTRLAIQLGTPAPGDLGHGGISLRGGWPERHEAEAVLSSVGPAPVPSCFASAGYTSGWFSGIFGTNLIAMETHCGAAGGECCRFDIREATEWHGHGARARAGDLAKDLVAQNLDWMLEALPFEALRGIVVRSLPAIPDAAGADRSASDGFDSGAPVIHVWGPVMVVPFAGVDESLRALELIGRDPGARGVRVVIVDLSGAIIDDGFGAVALEQILAAIEAWGAEPILAGITPLSEPVIAGLETSHVVIQKDLHEAIAAGFQIADAQRVSA